MRTDFTLIKSTLSNGLRIMNVYLVKKKLILVDFLKIH